MQKKGPGPGLKSGNRSLRDVDPLDHRAGKGSNEYPFIVIVFKLFILLVLFPTALKTDIFAGEAVFTKETSTHYTFDQFEVVHLSTTSSAIRFHASLLPWS